jgi:hypothetical protein
MRSRRVGDTCRIGRRRCEVPGWCHHGWHVLGLRHCRRRRAHRHGRSHRWTPIRKNRTCREVQGDCRETGRSRTRGLALRVGPHERTPNQLVGSRSCGAEEIRTISHQPVETGLAPNAWQHAGVGEHRQDLLTIREEPCQDQALLQSLFAECPDLLSGDWMRLRLRLASWSDM